MSWLKEIFWPSKMCISSFCSTCDKGWWAPWTFVTWAAHSKDIAHGQRWAAGLHQNGKKLFLPQNAKFEHPICMSFYKKSSYWISKARPAPSSRVASLSILGLCTFRYVPNKYWCFNESTWMHYVQDCFWRQSVNDWVCACTFWDVHILRLLWYEHVGFLFRLSFK